MFPTWSYRREQTLIVLTSEDQSTSDNAAPDNAANSRSLFARAPLETSLAFEQRLRECLDQPSLLQSLNHAILRCEPDWDDRTILRRTRLVAARLKSGGSLTLSYNTPNEGPADLAFTTRLERLVRFASKALEPHHLTVRILAESQLTEAAAPLAAAWHRLQRTRQNASSSPQKTVQRRRITAHVAEQVTYTLLCPPTPAAAAVLAEHSSDGPSPSLVVPVVFPTVVPRR